MSLGMLLGFGLLLGMQHATEADHLAAVASGGHDNVTVVLTTYHIPALPEDGPQCGRNASLHQPELTIIS